jgi:hypothetical protein
VSIEERMRRLILNAAAELRGAGHEPAVYNEYGSVITPGYKVESFDGDDIVRVEHKLPESDLTDPNRMGTDEKYFARSAARDAYAVTLRAAGWTVEERTVHVNRPILLAVFETDRQGGNPAESAPTCENR